MVSPLFFSQWVLVALVWLCVMLHWTWPSDPAPVWPTTPEPSPPLPTRTREPQPCAGLTHKPHCDAREHAPARRPQAPSAPPPRLVPTRVRSRSAVSIAPPLGRLGRGAQGTAACRRRLRRRAGGRRTFYGDLHPLDADHDVGPPTGAGEVNDHPALIAHGGDAPATPQGTASADGRVRAAEIREVRQVVHGADRIGAADAHLTDGEAIDAAGIRLPLKGEHAPAPTIADARGDRGRVHREGGVRFLRRRGEAAEHHYETRDGNGMHDGTTHGSTLLSSLHTYVPPWLTEWGSLIRPRLWSGGPCLSPPACLDCSCL